jgi:hypothetical protein
MARIMAEVSVGYRGSIGNIEYYRVDSLLNDTVVPISSPVIEHYDYDELEDCSCIFCRTYQMSRNNYYDYLVRLGEEAADTKNARLKFIAASMKRDIYSEFSFSMRNQPDRDKFLVWLFSFILTLNRSDGWWQARSQDLPKEFWMRHWRRNLTLAKKTTSS